MRPIPAATSLLSLFAACAVTDDGPGTVRTALEGRCVAVVDRVAGGVVADTYVASRRANRNFDGELLRVGPDGPAGLATTLVRPALPVMRPGERVESASLDLHQLTRSQPDATVTAHRVLLPWQEATVTFATFAGAFAAAPAATARANGRGYATRLDLTALTRSWFADPGTAHGVAIRSDDPLGYADETFGPRRRPTFTVCFTSCTDGAHNGDETGVDCGGALCGPCVIDADGDGDPATTDCADHDPAVHHGAAELCNAVDDDCDGAVDQGNPGGGGACAGTCGPGTEVCRDGALVCDAPGGAAETCNGLDDDCDGVVDDGNPGGLVDCRHTISYNPLDPTEVGGWFYGYTSCTAGAVACLGTDTIERCDGADNDLDGLVDEEAVQCLDADGDESGDPLHQIVGCTPVPGYVFDCGDCNDADPSYGTQFPGELACDPSGPDPYADHDCDGILDRGERDCT